MGMIDSIAPIQSNCSGYEVDLANTEAEPGSRWKLFLLCNVLGRRRHDQLPDHWLASKQNLLPAEIVKELTTRCSGVSDGQRRTIPGTWKTMDLVDEGAWGERPTQPYSANINKGTALDVVQRLSIAQSI